MDNKFAAIWDVDNLDIDRAETIAAQYAAAAATRYSLAQSRIIKQAFIEAFNNWMADDLPMAWVSEDDPEEDATLGKKLLDRFENKIRDRLLAVNAKADAIAEDAA